MTDPNNPLNLLLTLETALHKSHKGRWPNNVRNAVQGLRHALAARYETPAGPVYGSIDACAEVQRAHTQNLLVMKPVLDESGERLGVITAVTQIDGSVMCSIKADEGMESRVAQMVRGIEGPVSIGYRKA
jgi:hypothetical protein